MFSCQADIAMDAPERCLKRLCKHWSHKFQVTYDQSNGNIDFQPASCELKVLGDVLRVRIQTPEQGELVELQEIVAEHIQRMTQQPLIINWLL